MLPRLVVLGTIFTAACALSDPPPVSTISANGLRSGTVEPEGLVAFSSMDELRRVTEDVAERRRIEMARANAVRTAECRAWTKADNVVGIDCSAPLVETVTVSAAAAESITNVQHEGVAEGGIVKRHGNVLVVLRRGRLFTVGIDGDALDAVDVADADGGGPQADDTRAWYDELLLWQDTAIVIGYNYARGGSEIGLFGLSNEGHLNHRATYHLRSDDYYSSENYASRLIGHTLVMYTTQRMREDDPATWLPALRRWRAGQPVDPFENIAPIQRIFRPVKPLGPFPTVHTQILCDLAAPAFRCEATVLLGDGLAVYYASPRASYTWTTNYGVSDERSVLYRLPFDGGAVAAVGVSGRPVDQLAFRERPDGNLHVVVSATSGDTHLMSVPAAAFGPDAPDLADSQYRVIAHNFGPWPAAQFIGDQVVVASSSDDTSSSGSRVVVADIGGTGSSLVSVTHDVERIEALGTAAVLIGQEGDALRVTALRLGATPHPAGTVLLDGAEQAESRSHGFFYRKDGQNQGVFGVPITTSDQWNARRPESARIVFVSNRDLLLAESGTLAADPDGVADDRCRVSCTDWYGNARPVFIGQRIFALMGYEIVEGRMQSGHVTEVRRLDFTPGTRQGQ